MQTKPEISQIFFSESDGLYGVVVSETQVITIGKENRLAEESVTINLDQIPDDSVIVKFEDIEAVPCRGVLLLIGISYGFFDAQDLI